VTQCDLLVVNKIDLAPYVGVDLERMIREAEEVRGGKPVLSTNCAVGAGVDAVIERLCYDALLEDAVAS
jgi:urease accessory protein